MSQETVFQLVLASTNVHKIRELREMLKLFPKIDLLSFKDFPSYIPPEETGTIFEENAILKAETAAKILGKWVLAEDSGLIVPSLKGVPGVYSARYAGEGATDSDNRKKLLKEMSHLSDEERNAYFECCLALASPEGIKKMCTGICEGMIAPHEIGGNGFGYDPLFIKHGYNKSFAELGSDIKNRVSHRRKAFDKMINTFESLLNSESALSN